MARRLAVVLCALLLLVGLEAGAEERFGGGVTLSELTPISVLAAEPESWVGKMVLVEGTVVEVCAKRGCWMDIAGDQAYQKIRIKVDDGVIVFPMSARGKVARVQGTVEAVRRTPEEAEAWARHLAEEQGRPFDPASAAAATTEYRVRATGAVIR